MTNNPLTAVQAATIIGVHDSTVREFCQKGLLPATKGKRGAWQIDEVDARRFAASYEKSHIPRNPNRTAFDKPVGNGHKTKHRARPVQWSSVDEQIEATLAGKVRPLYLTAAGEVMTR